MSGKFGMEKDAREDALKAGVREIAKYTGIEVSNSEVKRKVFNGRSSDIIDYTVSCIGEEKQVVESFLSKCKAAEWYVERWREGKKNYYLTWVLVKIPCAEADKIIEENKKREECERVKDKVLVYIVYKFRDYTEESIVAETEVMRILAQNGFKPMSVKELGVTGTKNIDIELTQLKYKAGIFLRGEITTEYHGEKIELPDEKFYYFPLYSATMNIFMKDVVSGTVISSKNETQREYGKTKQVAEEKAIKKTVGYAVNSILNDLRDRGVKNNCGSIVPKTKIGLK
jgi:hypothetical protein